MNQRQRHQQMGRIHQAAKKLDLAGDDYRDLLEALTGCRSCADMTDSQVNHALDWLYFMAGRRRMPPLSWNKSGRGDAKTNLVRLCHAIADIVPPGWQHPPLRSASWRVRTCGWGGPFEELDIDQLTRLLEAVKAIFRRTADRPNVPLDHEHLDGPRIANAVLPLTG